MSHAILRKSQILVGSFSQTPSCCQRLPLPPEPSYHLGTILFGLDRLTNTVFRDNCYLLSFSRENSFGNSVAKGGRRILSVQVVSTWSALPVSMKSANTFQTHVLSSWCP